MSRRLNSLNFLRTVNFKIALYRKINLDLKSRVVVLTRGEPGSTSRYCGQVLLRIFNIYEDMFLGFCVIHLRMTVPGTYFASRSIPQVCVLHGPSIRAESTLLHRLFLNTIEELRKLTSCHIQCCTFFRNFRVQVC
jgi:hypothetical protein